MMNRLMLDMNWCLEHLRRTYFMALPESETDYEQSRKRYIVGDSPAQTIAQLAGGTFLVSFAAGQLLDFLQRTLITLPGKRFYAQQFTNSLGAWFLLITILFLKFKVQKRERQIQKE